MKTMTIGGMEASQVSLGCMRLKSVSAGEAEALIKTALDHGINYFDHADCYGDGLSEEIFSQAVDLRSSLRQQMLIQTKCGIRNDGVSRYDFSKEHILESVDGSLRRLKTDYLDALLLHRPDPLVEPEEVAEAFERLHAAGKVRYFGVSNQSPMLIELLQKYIRQPLLINQLQFSVCHALMLDQEIHFNMDTPFSPDRSGEIIEYCRLKDITIQAWSPFQYGFFEGVFVDNPKFPELNQVLGRIAQEHNTNKSAVAVAWILRHPAHMQVIVGTMNAKRLSDISQATDFTLTREEWYEIYAAAGKQIP